MRDSIRLNSLTIHFCTVNLTRMDIIRPSWSPSMAESLIKSHFHTASLTRLNLSLFFSPIPISLVTERDFIKNSSSGLDMCQTTGARPVTQTENIAINEGNSCASQMGSKCVLDFLTLMDSAVMCLLMERLGPIAPCLFVPGYLEV